MDTAMRDLDQLRERGDGRTGRKLTVVALGTLVTVAAVFAMGILVGSSSDVEPEPETDPLAQLDRAAGSAPVPSAAAASRGVVVSPEDLSFPATLTSDPLVEAAVRAAAREHAALGGDDAPADPAVPPRRHVDSTGLSAGETASGQGVRLARVAQHDALVAAALPRNEHPTRASAGHTGKFTLQVVSYDSRAEADTFADTLRARGHEAFVVQADVPGRGRYHRVRIGPFATRREALSYQAAFEKDESMHTLVVKRPRTETP